MPWTVRLILLSLLLLSTAVAGGCFGPDFRPGEGEFWWDDRQQQQLDTYELPPEPCGEEVTTPAAQPEPKKPSFDPSKESTATLEPYAR